MASLRIGLVGCGGIGGVHARAWAQVEGAEVVAACDVDLERAAATAPRAFSHWDEMLAGVELDAVDICTPPHLHAPAALAAIKAGKPVLCEKPLARNPAEARQILDAAAEAGSLLVTAFCHRFHPPVEWVKAQIDAGSLGRILMFRNRFGTRFKGVEDKWFSNPEIAGGGALMDTSIHSVDLFRFLVGEVEAASALTSTFSPNIHGLEDSAAMLLRAESGAIGVIEASWMTPWSANVVEIYGELGAAVIDYDTGVTRVRHDGDSDWTTMPGDDRSRFVEELRHFASVLRGETAPRMTGHDGLRAVEVLYQAYGKA